MINLKQRLPRSTAWGSIAPAAHRPVLIKQPALVFKPHTVGTPRTRHDVIRDRKGNTVVKSGGYTTGA